MNYADIKPIDSANGPGVRVSLFVSGCTHACKNCFNKEAWDFNYGKPFTDNEVELIVNSINTDYISGLSLLGGEPLHPNNMKDVLHVINTIKVSGCNKTIWCYSGYIFEELIEYAKENSVLSEILQKIDVLVDGKFEEDKKDLRLRFRGSSNQRLIDMSNTLKSKEIILWDK